MASVSVVMSVYNGEALLSEAVESVLAQTFGDFEFVIVDDGSKDRTAEILARYAERDARVRVIRQENRGRPEALNRGIQEALTPLVARMDADDVARPERLAQQVKLMNARPGVGLVGGPVEFIGVDGKHVEWFRPPVDDAGIRAKMRFYNVFYHPTVMMRREAVLAAGGYRKALRDADDYDLFLRIGERSEMANVEQEVLRYRVHAGQTSVVNLVAQALCCIAARTAAAMRGRGLADPLNGVTEIDAQFVRGLGVTDEEVRGYLAGVYVHWIGLFARNDPDAALQLVDRLQRLCEFGGTERRAVAAGLLRAAGIYVRQRRIGKAVASACKSVFVQPIEAGRHLRWAITRRVAPAWHHDGAM